MGSTSISKRASSTSRAMAALSWSSILLPERCVANGHSPELRTRPSSTRPRAACTWRSASQAWSNRSIRAPAPARNTPRGSVPRRLPSSGRIGSMSFRHRTVESWFWRKPGKICAQHRSTGDGCGDCADEPSLRIPVVPYTRRSAMKWVTRERAKVDRIACPWLIRRFIDRDGGFLFVPTHKALEVAERTGAIPFDVPGVEFGHHGKECSFDALVKKHNLDQDPAIVLLAKIVNGADTDNTLWNQPEAAGLNAIAEGFRHLGYKNDLEMLAAESIVYDALYAYCQHAAETGKRGDAA